MILLHFKKYNFVNKVFTVFIAGYLNRVCLPCARTVFVFFGFSFLIGCSVPDYLNPVKGYEAIEDTVTGWFEDDEEYEENEKYQETEKPKEVSEDQEIPESLKSDQKNKLYEDEVERDLAQPEPVTTPEKRLDLEKEIDSQPQSIEALENDFRPIEKSNEYEVLEEIDETPIQDTPSKQLVLNKSRNTNLLDNLDSEAFAGIYELAGSALVGSIYYDVGSSAILSSGKPILKKTIDVYKRYGGRVRVIGYASPNPGSEKDPESKLNNFRIASERSEVVAQGLIEMGINIKDLIIDSKSDTVRSTKRSGRFHFAKDRRVDIFLIRRK